MSSSRGYAANRQRLVVASALLFVMASHLHGQDAERVAPTHRFVVERAWFRMRDGVQLSATLFKPLGRTPTERFPAIFEFLPYRKDDSFYLRDYPLYAYFATRGLLGVRVDVRGTGGSGGRLPEREYSETELADAEEVIAQLAQRPDVNGRVGMWGISWGGFNALQVAMRHPPALRAILALHASDDLFYDDVHYIDGVFHMDPYAVQIDHENGLPRSPDYPIDSAYFADRFDVEPWIFTYARHATDGPWWQGGSLRFQYERLTIPTYLIGGLLDGYRDTPFRALADARVPLQVEIGPWAHDWPDTGTPGPTYEWRRRAVRWWRRWLLDDSTSHEPDRSLIVFMRAGDPPNEMLQRTSGSWRRFPWPAASGDTVTWLLDSSRVLTATGARVGVLEIPFRAGAGTAAGDWWGDATGDQANDDRAALVFDTPPLATALAILGMPRVVVRLRSANVVGDFSLRLEDVAPDGRVALVTGALRNGAFRHDRLRPAPLAPDEWFDLYATLHATTWVVQPGHRLRLAIATAQFPMAWPSPERRSAWVHTGPASRLELPTVPVDAGEPVRLPPSEPRAARPDARRLSAETTPPRAIHRGDTTIYVMQSSTSYVIGSTRIAYEEAETYRVRDAAPGFSSFRGVASHQIQHGARRVRLETTMDVRSTPDSFAISVRRVLHENGREVRDRTWSEVVPRRYH